MKALFTVLSFFLLVSLYGQNITITSDEDNQEKKATHQSIIKIGASVRGEVYSNYRHYDYYYYNEGDDYEGGYNVPVFVSFEHIWELKNQKAVSIEPMIGVSIRKNLTSFFVGSEFKFYWANTGFWRSGISLNPTYSYGLTNTSRWVSMDDGNYQQLKDLSVHYSIFSIDPGIIPFQFRIKNSPIIIESMFSLVGLNVVNRTSKFQTGDDTSERLRSTDVYPYFLKFELKVGFVLP